MNHETPDHAVEHQFISVFLESNVQQLREGQEKIAHCIAQLDDEQLWWRPREQMNSIANVLLHLSGNLRQWLIHGLRNTPDTRRRQFEFDDRSGRSGQQLMWELGETIAEACDSLRQLNASELLRVRRVQQFDINGFQTIADSVCHFRGHVQEIVHMTRVLKGEQYVFHFVPDES